MITAEDVTNLVNTNPQITSTTQLSDALGICYGSLRSRPDAAMKAALDSAVQTFKARRRLSDIEIIQMLANGLTLSDIARVTGQHERTLHNRAYMMRVENNCATCAELVAHAFREGWVK